MSDKFADRMREFGDNLGIPNRKERRRLGLTKGKARKQGWIPEFAAPGAEGDPKQVQIKKPKKGRPTG